MQRMSGVLRNAMDVDSAGLWLTSGDEVRAMALTPDLAESIQPYIEYYRRLDPWTISYLKHPNQVRAGYEEVPERELVKTEFYNDFASRFGLFRPMGVVTDIEPGVTLSLALSRNSMQNLLQPEDKAALEQLAPHVKRALQTRMRFEAGTSGWQASAFDQLAFGVVVCEAFGRVIYANAAAGSLTAQSRGLRLAGVPTRVGALVPKEAEALARLVFAAASPRPSGGGVRLTGADGRSLSVLVTPLPPAVADGFGGGKALLSIAREDATPSAGVSALRSLYGLSQAQAELCRGLATGKTFEEIAVERGVAVSTLRTHLATVLVRTGSRNLRDLIRLLGALPPLARGISDP